MALEIDTGSGLMPVHVWEPAGGSGPGLLLLQEIFGVSDYIQQRAAFGKPMPAFHHAEASALAWTRTTSFLARRPPTV